MEHLALALNIVSFSLGLAAVLLSFFAYARLHSPAFRQLASTFVGGLLLLIPPLLKSYDAVATVDFGAFMTVVYAVVSAAGYGLFSIMVPTLVFQVCSVRPSVRRAALHATVAVVAAALGAWHELAPGPVSVALATVSIIGVQAYAVAFLVPRLPGISDKHVGTLLRRLCIVAAIVCVVTVGQYIIGELDTVPRALRSLPLAQALYFVLAILSVLGFALRYPLASAEDGALSVPESFQKSFGISPREKEIVTLVLRGYSNRMIAETLFISAMTVKNHIYHIYQKTGVENKIQLLNLIKTGK